MAGGAKSLEQECVSFYFKDWPINTYDGPEKSYYICRILGQLENNSEDGVTTNTSKNTKSNDEVTSVYYYWGQTVKFIPNSLFDTFSNLEFLYVDYKNKFETMKREYLQNATKLKNLKIFRNSLRIIDGNVFSEAKNLEHINLSDNQIMSIHKEAFNGLPNLKGVFLLYTKITNLHPTTFSFIVNLNVLHLTGGENCVNERFISASQKFPEIEGKISARCTYEPFPDEVVVEDKNKAD